MAHTALEMSMRPGAEMCQGCVAQMDESVFWLDKAKKGELVPVGMRV